MTKRAVLLPLTVFTAVGLFTGWYFFRPERAFIDVHVGEPAVSPAASVVLSGTFTPMAHEGRGDARVLRLPDGRLVLRFSRFATSNGPDVRVYLLGAATVRDDGQLASAGFLDLGALKGNVGDQNYEIPAGTELSRYRAVAVWCRRFGVNFTTASLAPPTVARTNTVLRGD